MAGTFVSVNYGIIAWCSYKIMHKIRTAPSVSRRSDAVNRQMNYILGMQALSPLIIAVIPIVSAYYSILSSSRNPVLQFIVAQVTTVLAWTAVLNPLYTIFFVKAYRVTVKRLAQGLLTHSTTVSSMTPDDPAVDTT